MNRSRSSRPAAFLCACASASVLLFSSAPPLFSASGALKEAAELRGRGRSGEALESCLTALERGPDAELYSYALEILPEGPSEYSRRFRAITARELADEPDNAAYLLGLCKLLRGSGRRAEGLANCKKARDLDPTSWVVYRELGAAYSLSGDGEKALEALERGTEMAPGNFRPFFHLAAENAKLGRYADAMKNYGKARELIASSTEPGSGIYARTILAEIKRLEKRGARGETAPAAAAPKRPAGEAAVEKAPESGAAPSAESREVPETPKISSRSISETMEELRLRGAADAKKTAPSMEDLDLLEIMRQAELDGAVDYLREKQAGLGGLVVEKKEGGQVRLLLRPEGLKRYQALLSREAVPFFEKKKIPLQEVFTLRDLRGRPVFGKDGRLTYDGLRAYWRARSGAKAWLMHYETPAREPAPEDEKMAADADALKKIGFQEISEPEYLWLLKTTSCPEDILRSPPCDIRMLTAPKRRKYFLCSAPPPACSDEAGTLAGYVARYRNNDDWTPDDEKSTAFFGTGAMEKRRFCHDGRIWKGD